MKRSGTADLKLMGGSIPTWLFDRMTRLSLPIVESILMEYGKKSFSEEYQTLFGFKALGQ